MYVSTVKNLGNMEGQNTNSANHSLWVGGFPIDVDEADLFNTFPKVSSIKLCKHIDSGLSLGHAYLNFQQESDGKIIC